MRVWGYLEAGGYGLWVRPAPGRVIGSVRHWGRIWGIGAGYDALGQVNNLPQWALTCPSAG